MFDGKTRRRNKLLLPPTGRRVLYNHNMRVLVRTNKHPGDLKLLSSASNEERQWCWRTVSSLAVWLMLCVGVSGGYELYEEDSSRCRSLQRPGGWSRLLGAADHRLCSSLPRCAADRPHRGPCPHQVEHTHTHTLFMLYGWGQHTSVEQLDHFLLQDVQSTRKTFVRLNSYIQLMNIYFDLIWHSSINKDDDAAAGSGSREVNLVTANVFCRCW